VLLRIVGSRIVDLVRPELALLKFIWTWHHEVRWHWLRDPVLRISPKVNKRRRWNQQLLMWILRSFIFSLDELIIFVSIFGTHMLSDIGLITSEHRFDFLVF